jgi:hypothetical protein
MVAGRRIASGVSLDINPASRQALEQLIREGGLALRRSHAHHRDVRTAMRAELSAGHRAPRDQDRYVMIEIALSTATLRRPFLAFLPLTVKKVSRL